MMKKLLIIYLLISFTVPSIIHSQDDNRLALEKVFKDWREFEKPPLLNGAPDYTIDTFNNRMPEFRKLRDRLNEIEDDFYLDAFLTFQIYMTIFNKQDSHIIKKETERIMGITQWAVRNSILESLGI